MSKLNRDVLYLIFEELKYDKNTLYSCLLVSKTFCEIIVPFLWENPWKYLEGREKEGKANSLLRVILSQFSKKSKSNVKKKGVDFSYQQRPLFDYIGFCRHLNLSVINEIIDTHIFFETSKISVKDEVVNLFVNENTKFTHLYINKFRDSPKQFDFPIHLIPGAERCFSELQFLSCSTRINDDVLAGLAELCKSMKELELIIEHDNHEILKLIKSSPKLYSISVISILSFYKGKLFHTDLENSLIKHANTIQYFKINRQPVTKILSSFVNLKRLDLINPVAIAWDCLDNASFPSLQILNVRDILVNNLIRLIGNTSGSLIKIKIDDYIYQSLIDNKRFIQTIYQNCPNLEYLKLEFKYCNIPELENLLINCQRLSGLFILTKLSNFDWDKVFKILIESSPTSLFRFKFSASPLIEYEYLKFFFDNWKGRRPMLLHTDTDIYDDLIKKYEAEGIVKKYCRYFEDIEWI